MANIRGLGDLADQRGGGEYSALRGRQAPLGGIFQGDAGGQNWQQMWDAENADGPQSAHIPLFRRRAGLPDLLDVFAPRFHSRSFTFFITIIEIAMFTISMVVGHFFGDGALVPGNQLAGPSGRTMNLMGAKNTHQIRDLFQYWRLVTPIFLHGGVLHLASNLFFLSQCSYSLELRFGTLQLAAIFVLSGIAGDMLSCIGNPSSDSVGASGCLFGLLGADLVYLYLNWQLIPEKLAQCELCFVAMLLLINTMVGGSNANLVDNYAHLGGFLGGIVCGFSLVKLLRPEQEPRKDFYRRVGLLGTLALWLFFFVALYTIPAK